jgi:hypothetical protein
MPRALKLSLVPRTNEFFDLFSRAGENTLKAARLIERRFREYPTTSVTQADIKGADVDDHMDEASELLDLYGVETPTRQAIEQCRILVGAAEHLAAALKELKGLHGVERELAALKELEDEGDRVVHDAIADLFRDPRIDPLIVIRWKDIFEALEDALDACETAANVVGNIVVKNA